ncbi:hypothetical protein GF380_06380 [Candidatus Uhrbacteria bacterium]|nr:hypothetical protein [Candidatus Uhrbacteria bacterium]MBD3284576.1 hypothetical protein [Candidatus Uhrbacteria bacterium]
MEKFNPTPDEEVTTVSEARSEVQETELVPEREHWWEHPALLRNATTKMSQVLMTIQREDPLVHRCMPLNPEFMQSLAELYLEGRDQGVSVGQLQDQVYDCLMQHARYRKVSIDG